MLTASSLQSTPECLEVVPAEKREFTILMSSHKYSNKQAEKLYLHSTLKSHHVIFPTDWKLLTQFKSNILVCWLRGMTTIASLILIISEMMVLGYFKYCEEKDTFKDMAW